MSNFMQAWQKRMVISGVLLVPAVALSFGLISAGKERTKTSSIGERFHSETSVGWFDVVKGLFSKNPPMPPQYKRYVEAPSIKLPVPDHSGISVEDAIKRRRSVRNYSPKNMKVSELSQLLFAAQGITGKMYGQPLRSAPSAGALYPFEIYMIVNNVQDIGRGIYHYNVLDHSLELIRAGDFSKRITDAGLKQDMLGEADVTFILSAIFDRTRHKYGERGFRYVYMEAGHISQNIALQAVSLGLGSVCVGAFSDDRVNDLIGVDGHKEAAIYLHAVGTL